MKKIPNKFIAIAVFIFGMYIFTSPQWHNEVVPSLNDDISILEITKPDRDLIASYLYNVESSQKEYYVRMIVNSVLSEDFPDTVEEVLHTVYPFSSMDPVECEADEELLAILLRVLYF